MIRLKDYSYSSLYVIVCSLATVLIDNLVNSLSPLTALLYVTIIAIVYFHIVNYKKIWGVYSLFLTTHKITLLFVNLCIIVMWMCTYYGNYYSSPTVFNYLYFTTLGIVSRFKSVSNIKNDRLRMVVSVLLILMPFYLSSHQFLGAILAIVGGVSAVIYNIITFKLTAQTNITATQTLAVRFWGLLLLLVIMSTHSINIHALTVDLVLKIFLLAFFSFILQLWLSQKGLYAIGVKYHGVILSLTPLGTLLLQGFILHQWYWSFLLLTLICPFVLNDILWNKINPFKGKIHTL